MYHNNLKHFNLTTASRLMTTCGAVRSTFDLRVRTLQYVFSFSTYI